MKKVQCIEPQINIVPENPFSAKSLKQPPFSCGIILPPFRWEPEQENEKKDKLHYMDVHMYNPNKNDKEIQEPVKYNSKCN